MHLLCTLECLSAEKLAALGIFNPHLKNSLQFDLL